MLKKGKFRIFTTAKPNKNHIIITNNTNNMLQVYLYYKIIFFKEVIKRHNT